MPGCIGKLEAKQSGAKPKTLCAMTGDLAILAGRVDAFVAKVVGAVRTLE